MLSAGARRLARLCPSPAKISPLKVLGPMQSCADWHATQHALHELLWRDSIGKIEAPFLPANPRTRLLFENDKLRAYEVMLDVFPDVYAWGYLLVPRDLKPGEKRPVVVCQH